MGLWDEDNENTSVPVLMTQSCGEQQMWDDSVKKLGRIKCWATAESGQLYGGGSKNARRLWFSGYIILFLACCELCKNRAVSEGTRRIP